MTRLAAIGVAVVCAVFITLALQPDGGDPTEAIPAETTTSAAVEPERDDDATAGAALTGTIDLALSTGGGSVGGPLDVTVELVNGTDDVVTLVRPTVTPNLVSFRIQDEAGTRMPFYGPQPQLRPLGDEHFVELAPGESATGVIDIGPGYRLGPGRYTVTAEYLNPANASHGGGRAVIFEPGTGPVAAPIEIEVTS